VEQHAGVVRGTNFTSVADSSYEVVIAQSLQKNGMGSVPVGIQNVL
jgi:hypothetical protein